VAERSGVAERAGVAERSIVVWFISLHHYDCLYWRFRADQASGIHCTTW